MEETKNGNVSKNQKMEMEMKTKNVDETARVQRTVKSNVNLDVYDFLFMMLSMI